MAGLMTLVYVVNTMNQGVILVVAQQIKVDLSLTDAELGLTIGLYYMFFSALAAIPLGRLGDIVARHLVVGWSLTLMSAASAMAACVSQFVPFVVLRCVAATADAGIMPAAVSWISEAVEAHRRALALAVFNAGGAVGAFASYWGLSMLADRFGWRAAYFSVGVLGIVVGLLIAFVLPADTRSREHRKNEILGQGQLRQLASNKAYRQIVLVFISSGFTSSAAWGWVSPLLQRAYGYSLPDVGALLGIGFGVATAAGSLAFGMIATHFCRQRPAAKLGVALLMQLASAICLILALSYGGLVTSTLVVAALFFAGGGMVVVLETIQFVVPKELSALAVGLALLLFNLFGQGLGPVATGLLSDALADLVGANALKYAVQLCMGAGSIWICTHLALTAIAVDKLAPLEGATQRAY